MIIGVKGTRTAQTETAAETYAFRYDPTRSKAPLALGLALAGAMAYLKSMASPDEAVGAEAPPAGAAPRTGAPATDAAVAAAPEAPEAPAARDGEAAPDGPAAPAGNGSAGAGRGELGGELVFRPPSPLPKAGGTPPGSSPQPANLPAPPQPSAPGLPGAPSEASGGSGGGGGSGGKQPEAGTGGQPPAGSDGPGGGSGGTGGGSGGTGGGSGGGSEEPERNNRAPRVGGPVYLPDVALGAALLVGLGDLLRGAVDPDGDGLSVQYISASHGSLVASETGWLFQPAPHELGPVTITYVISDGALSVPQVAYLNVVRGPIEGSIGDDLLIGTPYADEIDGKEGDDSIDAREGDDVVAGGAGDDHIAAGAGDDLVFAGAGDDIVFGGAGNDRIFGGAGDDRIFGGAGNDILHGEDGADVLYGDAGDDVLLGGAGDDILAGGAGSDAVLGGTGNDRIVGDLDAASDVLDGGAGQDVLDYSQATRPVTVNLGTGRAWGAEIGEDSLSGFETAIGGAGDDTLIGGAGHDTLIGGAGSDTLDGGAGNDILADGTGSDLVRGGAGDDRVIAAADGTPDVFDGGTGTDVIDYSASTASVTIDLGAGRAWGIEIGEDCLMGFESAIGGAGDDRLVAGAGPSVFAGGAGSNRFEYCAPGDAQLAVSHAILDFKAGDTIRMSKWDIFERAVDAMEDRFRKVYGDDDEHDLPIRYRHEDGADGVRTIVEADLDLDEDYETTVSINGHHFLAFVETC